MAFYVAEINELFLEAGTSYMSYYDEYKPTFTVRQRVPIAHLANKVKYSREFENNFKITIGEFQRRLKKAIVPIHLIFWPFEIFKNTKLGNRRTLCWIFSFIAWVLSVVAAYFLEIFLDYLYQNYIQQAIASFLSHNS